MWRSLINLAEQGKIPDLLIRTGINQILATRLRQEKRRFRKGETLAGFAARMADYPLAINTQDANQQHYEVPVDFYDLVLGENKKYSSALFYPETDDLNQAEADMLRLTCDRAGLEGQQSVLELGCGWGSLTLWMAEHYPDLHITAVSNSESQKDYIENAAEKRDLTNIEVITCDMNEFDTEAVYDRVVCVEMFEHMRNHGKLMENISGWLKPGGRFFLHSFCHRDFPYFYEDEGESDWMARHFFTGGVMPAWDLPLQFQQQLKLVDRWAINGEHYARTCRAWLSNCDRNREQILAIFSHSPDPSPPEVQLNRWRLFFMACECLFACLHGNEWFVGHYLFEKHEPAR
ncbi:MAG: class I SAM-dependent methyltransferase [Pseudomonadales bacterium]|nr:class I SAM-dependent methyltransferase [Pseudomonadales bacterium]